MKPRPAPIGRRARAAAVVVSVVAGCAAAVLVLSGTGSRAASSPLAPSAFHPAPASLSAPSAAVRARPLGMRGHWRLVFDDEFSGTRLDSGKWSANWLGSSSSATTAPDNPTDLNCVSPGQTSEAADRLELAATHRSCRLASGARYDYSAGLVQTRNTFTFTYGYMEARVLVPLSRRGAAVDFPGFWAAGVGRWPNAGEIDVMEIMRGCGPGYGYYFTSSQRSAGGCVHVARTSGWHVFGARWSPGSVDYYLDGHEVGTVTGGVTPSPMFLVLNESLDPARGGPNLAPVRMLVDYVRVWQ